MKQGTYYSRNRAKVLERERLRRQNLNLEQRTKLKEYQKKYYYETLKGKRGTAKYDNRPTTDINQFKIKQGSFIISFN